MKILIRASIITAMSTLLISCGASLEEYQKFASAGKKYASAIDTLLVTSGNHFIDANSEILLRSDLQEPGKDLVEYKNITELDDRWLVLIGNMRQHSDLIKSYFIAVENLSTSTNPDEAKQSTEKIFTKLNAASNAIKGSPLVSDKIGSALSSIPQIILNQKIKGILREELVKRKEAIYKELVLQDLVLKLLTIQLKNNSMIIRDSKDNRTTLPSYTSKIPVSNPDDWIESRRNIRKITLSIEALDSSIQASEEFKEAFKLLLEDKFTIARANALLSDVESLLKVVDDLKKATISSQKGE